MSVVKWTPMIDSFEDMNMMMQGMLPAMQSARALSPAIDIYEDNNAIHVEAPLPGMDMEDVNISIENDVLTIEGRSEKKTEIDDKNYYRNEIRSGSFHRVIQLPVAVDGAKAEANYENGILIISIPKEERAKPKSIKVNVKK